MSDTTQRMARVFDEAIRLTAEKNSKYNDAWRMQGWRGNLSRILEKSERLRHMLWKPGERLLNGEKEHPRETAIDMINTLTFMILNMDAGREWGHEDVTQVENRVLSSNELYIDPPSNPAMTQVNMNVGELPVLGEEIPLLEDEIQQANAPSPRPRGSRKIKDAPQA